MKTLSKSSHNVASHEGAENTPAALTTAAAKDSDDMAATESIKSPAFQFYPSDFLSDSNVVVMSMAERGAYITLLCYCWTDGSLPSDVSRLARLCSLSTAAMKKLWPAIERCFHEDDSGRLIQPRLDRERQKQAEYREAGRIAGLASARARRERSLNDSLTPQERLANRKGDEPLTIDERKTNSSSSSSSSSSDFSHTHTRGSPTVMSGTLPRDHLSHAFCGKVCVPAFLHAQFISGLGTDTADETLRSFYRRVLDSIQGSIAPDPVKFWRERVAAQWPAPSVTRKPSEVRAGGDAYEAFDPNWAKDCFTLHGNACANAKEHAARMKEKTSA